MADGWKNKQPSATQELGRLFTSIEVVGGGGESSVSFLGHMLGNHLLQQLMQIILVLQHGLSQNRQLKEYGDQKQHQRNHKSLCT